MSSAPPTPSAPRPDPEDPAHIPLEALPAGIWIADAEGRTLRVNTRLEEMLGYRQEEMRNLDVGAFVRDIDGGLIRQYLRRRREGVREQLEIDLLRKDGTPLHAWIAVGPHRIGPEGPPGSLAVVLDFGARKRAEEAVELLARFPAENPNPVLRVSRDGMILYANPACAFLLETWATQIGGALPAPLRRPAAAAFEEGRERSLEIEVRGRTFSFLIAPYRQHGYLDLFSLDITDRRQLETQLRQAQKMEAVGLLAGGVAHDFNNLLFVINGRAELELRRLPPGDPTRAALELIWKTGERAAALTRQLLAFSRRQVLQPRVIHLNTIVTDLLKMLRRLIPESIELRTDLDPALLSTRADPAQIEQILLNLVINARDAMPAGGVLTLSTANVQLDEAFSRSRPFRVRAGPYVRLSVIDTGCGMDDQVKEHLFEPFFTTKAQGQGTGLGLATVYGIVKQSEGYIDVRSAVGKGTTVDVYLPRIEGDGISSVHFTALAPTGHETILLVEDVDLVRDLVRDMLQGGGYLVLDVPNAERALELAGRHPGPIHLLLTDVVMPGMNGPDLARRLRDRRPDTKVLFMSGYAEQAAACTLPDLRAQFIQKPVTAGELARKVREALDRES